MTNKISMKLFQILPQDSKKETKRKGKWNQRSSGNSSRTHAETDSHICIHTYALKTFKHKPSRVLVMTSQQEMYDATSLECTTLTDHFCTCDMQYIYIYHIRINMYVNMQSTMSLQHQLIF